MRRWLRFVFLGFALGYPILPMFAVAGRSVSVAPGSVVKWAGPGTTRCGMAARVWPALKGTCYYPIDLGQKPGVLTVVRWRAAARDYAHITVEAHDYGEERIELPDVPQAHPSAADMQRAQRETVLQGQAFRRKDGPAQFTLPLGPPSIPFPGGKSFGVTRYYNGKKDAEPHMGIDSPTPEGSPVISVADGTVVLVGDLFFAGKAVFIDHGDGLVSVYFHLGKIEVAGGDKVTKGQHVGTVDSTGRSTGPHLFFGIRWHDALINPELLLEDPAKIPEI